MRGVATGSMCSGHIRVAHRRLHNQPERPFPAGLLGASREVPWEAPVLACGELKNSGAQLSDFPLQLPDAPLQGALVV
jgi:hypothetical protein